MDIFKQEYSLRVSRYGNACQEIVDKVTMMQEDVKEIEQSLYELETEANQSKKLEPIFSLNDFKSKEAYNILNLREFIEKLYSSYWLWLEKQREAIQEY